MTLAYLFFVAALLITSRHTATGYESSIYHSTPWILWASLGVSIFIGTILTVDQVFSGRTNLPGLRGSGFLLIFLSFVVVLSLFIIRGYYMWEILGDPATHIGAVKDILLSATVDSVNFYPITHILASEIILVAGIDVIPVHKMLPLVASILCIPLMYSFLRYVLPARGEAILALLISCTLSFGWYLNFTPNCLSNQLFPIVLLSLYKLYWTRKIGWYVISIITIMLFIPFHAVPAIMLGLIILSFWIVANLMTLAGKRDLFPGRGWKQANFISLILLLAWSGCFILWFSRFSILNMSVGKIMAAVTGEISSSKISTYAAQAAYADSCGYNVAEHILKVFGSQMLIIAVTLISILFIWREMRKNEGYNKIFTLYGPFFAIGIFSAAMFLFNLSFSPLRMLIYLIFLGAAFSGFFAYRVIGDLKLKGGPAVTVAAISILILVLAGLFFNGMLNLYPSPYTLTQSPQTTEMEFTGMTWFLEERDPALPFTSISFAPGRFGSVILSPEERTAAKLPTYLSQERWAPYHFGYDQEQSLAAAYDLTTYLILNQRIRRIYADVYPEMAADRWTEEDFGRLRQDRGLQRVYANGEFDAWLIDCGIEGA